ncbi:signal peptidase I [Nocardioides sp. cx-169]|uniref:signal peptidase I n=1 Tax=Nocardioides sp. cx-169 TaxID=2899080 RepID=UPI001E3FA23D|nr:signal peptidase I [Nocardioides sp. cx-169]MCD4536174.1 signal peptidase I [Nocardioides sp. cx-169]
MSDATTPPEPAKRKLPLWLETVILLAVAVVLALVIKTFFVQAFYIPSASMKPGLVENDRILVEKVSYWFGGSPSRGDAVVFEDPGGWLSGVAPEPTSPLVKALTKIGLYPSGGHLVKRVIGVEGDTIVCCDEAGRLEVNGEPLDEDGFIQPQKCDGPMPGPACDWTAGPVPEGELFVMGDNRSASADSSARLCVGRGGACDPEGAFVPVDLVVGKVFALVWPLDRAHFVGRPDIFEDVPDAE